MLEWILPWGTEGQAKGDSVESVFLHWMETNPCTLVMSVGAVRTG